MDLERRKQEREKSKLDAIKASMHEHQKEELVRRAQKLKERQERKENLDLLPKVGLDDVPADIRVPSPQVRSLNGDRRLTTYAAGTNGIVYHQVVTRLGELPPGQLYHLPLYTQLVSEVGSAGRDYLETQHLQHGTTGGINVFTAVRAAIDDVNSPSAFLTFSSRTLNRKATDMIRLLRDTSGDARFDELGRIRDLVSQSRARRRAAVTNSGHVYAMAAAASALRPISWLNHQLTGLPGLLRLMALDDDLQDRERLAEFADSLAALHDYVRASEKQFLVISDQDFLDEAVSRTEAVWQEGPDCIPAKEFNILPGKSSGNQAWLLNTQVNFCAMAFPTVAETHSDSAALTVLAGVLGNSYLHGAIREQGGAYGAGAGHDTGS
ncbi:MAG: insulinase family protein, partial [Pseudohongiellaceae bacterium]